jgi:4-deoxy-L-threo-5-hexosulose-uronate ketol-isomerase
MDPGKRMEYQTVHISNSRRMEAYFYFEVPEDQAVCHFYGEPDETRHIWMHNDQAVLSPEWSNPLLQPPANYTFIWGMCGREPRQWRSGFFKITDLLKK